MDFSTENTRSTGTIVSDETYSLIELLFQQTFELTSFCDETFKLPPSNIILSNFSQQLLIYLHLHFRVCWFFESQLKRKMFRDNLKSSHSFVLSFLSRHRPDQNRLRNHDGADLAIFWGFPSCYRTWSWYDSYLV